MTVPSLCNSRKGAICDKVRVGKYYLCQSFKRIVGMTVSSYIEAIRTSIAKDLLAQTDKLISQIAQAVGFQSFAYFSKVFKKSENCTPKQYRKSYTDIYNDRAP